MKEVRERDGHAEEQLAAVDVVNDVHDLKHSTGVALRRSRLAGEEKEVTDVVGLGHAIVRLLIEGARQVVQGAGMDALNLRDVDRVVGFKAAHAQEVVDLAVPRERHLTPVNDRLPAEDEPDLFKRL